MESTWGRSSGFIPGSGDRPPRLLKINYALEDVWAFMHSYNAYIEKIRVLNADGRKRRVVSIRDLLNWVFAGLLKEDYFCGEQFTDDAIREALAMYVSEDEQ